jgi:LPXTG-site transpeptidase (sortase) family protein
MQKKLLRGALSTLVAVGAIIALWPLGQTAYSRWNQNALRADWEKSAATADRKSTRAAPAKFKTVKPQSPTKKVANFQTSKPDWPATRIVIPDAQTDAVVLDGWDESTLRRAPSHYPGSALPGQKGNCVIAGHRNVYGSPFYKADALNAGAPIELRTPRATYTYRVLSVFASTDSDMTMLQAPPEPNAKPRLTLVTCTIPRTSNRIIVSAELEDESS